MNERDEIIENAMSAFDEVRDALLQTFLDEWKDKGPFRFPRKSGEYGEYSDIELYLGESGDMPEIVAVKLRVLKYMMRNNWSIDFDLSEGPHLRPDGMRPCYEWAADLGLSELYCSLMMWGADDHYNYREGKKLADWVNNIEKHAFKSAQIRARRKYEMKTLVCSERVPSGLKIYENMKQMRKLQEALGVPNEYQFYLSGDNEITLNSVDYPRKSLFQRNRPSDVLSAAEHGIVRDD